MHVGARSASDGARARRCAGLLFLLFLGAIVNVSVAWAACLITTHPATVPPGFRMEGGGPWRVPFTTDWTGDVRAVASRYGLRIDQHYGLIQNPPVNKTMFNIWRAGWPFHSMTWLEPHAAPWASLSWGGFGEAWRHGIWPGAVHEAGARMEPWRRLPLRPEWPGFAANTIAFAGLWWVALFGTREWRRSRRRRVGRCIQCGYPIGVSDVCTECGNPVARDLETSRASGGDIVRQP